MKHSPQHLDNRALVERMFAIEFNFMKGGAVDQELLGEAFHPEVVVYEPTSLPYAGEWKGLGGAAALMRAMHSVWSDMGVSNLTISGDDHYVLLACELRMVARKTLELIEQPFAERLRFVDGLLIEGTPFYFDTAEIAAALNGPQKR